MHGSPAVESLRSGITGKVRSRRYERIWNWKCFNSGELRHQALMWIFFLFSLLLFFKLRLVPVKLEIPTFQRYYLNKDVLYISNLHTIGEICKNCGITTTTAIGQSSMLRGGADPQAGTDGMFACRNLERSREIYERVNSVFHLRAVKSDCFKDFTVHG